MAAPPLSKFLPGDAALTSSAELAVRVERDGDGVRVILRDKWGWFWIAHCEPAEVDGRRGYGGIAAQQPVPEALRLPGDDDPPGERPKPRGLVRKVPA